MMKIKEPDNYHKKLTGLLDKAGIYVSRMRSSHGFLLALTITWLVGLLIILENSLFLLGEGFRTLLVLIWLVQAFFFFFWLGLKPLINKPPRRHVALLYEHQYPELDARLVGSWDLLKDRQSSFGYSTNLIDSFAQKAYSVARELDYKKLFPKSTILNTSRWLVLFILITLAFMTITPSFFHKGFARTVNPTAHLLKPTETILTIIPGNYETVKYSQLTVKINAFGTIPDEVEVYRKLDTGATVKFSASKSDGKDQFEYQFKDLRHSFDYYVTGGDFESPVYTVTVIDNPRIIDLKLSYQYPGYTGLGTQVIEQNDGNIDALYGTRVQIEALANKKISEARMVFSDSTIQVMTINDNKLSTSFMISTEGSYHLECQDFAGNSNSDPIEYQIRVQLDDSPIVQIIKPGEDIDLTEEMLVPLGVLGEDDFGFSRFDLVFTKKGSADTSLKKLEFNDNRKSKVFLELVWSLAELDLLPEDIVTYWIVGYDNDQLRGPKAGESRHFSVRFPSLEEILQEVAQEQQKQEEDVEEVFEEGKRLQEQLEKISRELMKEKELNWEGKKELEKMLKDQEDMVKKLDQISQDMEMTLEKIQKNQLVTMEIFDKMQQIQEILDEIATPEMREAMQQLQEALQNMDPKALEEAMKNFQMNQEKMLEQLEQTLALLKRMQIEQRLSELIKLAMNQENTQQEINEALENMAPEDMPNLSNQQQQVSQACQFMEQELQKLADMMKEFQDMPGEMADSMAEKTKADSLPKLANQASSQMSQCNSKGCKKSGEQLQEDLTELRENLQKLQNEMNMMLREEVVEAIRKAIYDLIYLSNRQEGYYDTTLVSGVQEEVVVDLLEKQVVLKENLDGIADRVFDIGTKTFFLSPQVGVAIGEALIQVNQALETLSMRQSQRSLNFQQEAMTQMNMAALVLMNAMNQLSQSSSCSGAEKFFEMMQSMCQQQCGVNQQTIPMAGPKPGGSQPGGMDPSQQASAARLAAEQEEIKKNLEDLEREYGEYRNILGRFDETVQDMERVIEDLASSNVDHHTLERQERILSRMLDAQKSLHQRNYTQKRQSETGEDIVRRSPSGLPDDLGEDQNTIQQALIRALNQSYPRVYENMIRDYFKALGENLQSQSIEKTE